MLSCGRQRTLRRCYSDCAGPSSDPGRPRNGEALTRSRIVAVALDLAGKVGIENVGVRDVATALGLSVGALYHHVPGRSALEEALVESVLSDVRSADEFDGPPLDRIGSHIAQLQAALDEHPGIDGALLAHAPGSPRAAALRARIVTAFRDAGLRPAPARHAYTAVV